MLRWTEDANCLNKPIEIFFHPENYDIALEICSDCPVKGICLRYTRKREARLPADTPITGVYGGMTPQQRWPERFKKTTPPRLDPQKLTAQEQQRQALKEIARHVPEKTTPKIEPRPEDKPLWEPLEKHLPKQPPLSKEKWREASTPKPLIQKPDWGIIDPQATQRLLDYINAKQRSQAKKQAQAGRE